LGGSLSGTKAGGSPINKQGFSKRRTCKQVIARFGIGPRENVGKGWWGKKSVGKTTIMKPWNFVGQKEPCEGGKPNSGWRRTEKKGLVKSACFMEKKTAEKQEGESKNLWGWNT